MRDGCLESLSSRLNELCRPCTTREQQQALRASRSELLEIREKLTRERSVTDALGKLQAIDELLIHIGKRLAFIDNDLKGLLVSSCADRQLIDGQAELLKEQSGLRRAMVDLGVKRDLAAALVDSASRLTETAARNVKKYPTESTRSEHERATRDLGFRRETLAKCESELSEVQGRLDALARELEAHRETMRVA